jgi:hypothetical protein
VTRRIVECRRRQAPPNHAISRQAWLRSGRAGNCGNSASPASRSRPGWIPPPRVHRPYHLRYAPSLNRRLKRLGIKQVRTPFRCPLADAVAERWVKSARTECLDHLSVFNESTLRRAISSYVIYYNHHRPHRSVRQRAPCASGELQTGLQECSERSSQNQYSADCTTFIGTLHNRPHFCALQVNFATNRPHGP